MITTLIWRSEADAKHSANRLAPEPALQNAFIELRGDLGAGKTTFTRHLLRALGVTGPIKSPSYTVVEPYETPAGLRVWHFDFYRFRDPREWEDAGLRDLFTAQGLKIAEWPEHAAGVLPRADLVLELTVKATEAREVGIMAGSAAGSRLLHALVT
jgi:tRNA threonylcarbamoyladenosine biosynthesis protein TsaE